MKPMIRPLFVVIVLILASLACTVGSSAGSQSGDTLFSDDFSNTRSGWDKVNESNYSTDYYNDGYRFTLSDPYSDVWANPGSKNYTDVHIEVDATKNGGPDDNDFGIVCRYQDAKNFYFGVISSDGYMGILKMLDGEYAIIGRDTLTTSDAIYQGAATNRIRLDCVGSSLTLYANGTQVDQQSDDDFADGNVGLIAGTYGEGGVDIIFDNFYVYQP